MSQLPNKLRMSIHHLPTDLNRMKSLMEQAASEIERLEDRRHHEYAMAALTGLLANPERYKYIAQLVANGMSQEEATVKNVNKAFMIADAAMEKRAGK